jgi:autophagy-related protein 18
MQEEKRRPIIPIWVGFDPARNFSALLHSSGYRIFELNPFRVFVEEEGICAKLIALQLEWGCVALVGSGDDPEFSPRCVRLFDLPGKKLIAELVFAEAAMAVHLTENMIFVCTDRKIYEFDRKTLQKRNSIEVIPNVHEVICVSSKCLLGIPNSETKGELMVYDARLSQTIAKINAHDSKIACCVFSDDSSKIATSSEKGTLIRVFAIPSGEKLFSFRRGLYNAERISIAFNMAGTFLCSASSTNTLHLYNLDLANV